MIHVTPMSRKAVSSSTGRASPAFGLFHDWWFSGDGDFERWPDRDDTYAALAEVIPMPLA